MEKVNDNIEIEWNLTGSSRKELRDKAVMKFLDEKPGYWIDGVKHVTCYKYFVEKLKDGRRIYLLRPTFLNKGIDFQVWVERMLIDKDKRPSHYDIFKDLNLKKKENPKLFAQLMQAIDDVWNCKEPEDAKLNFKQGFPCDFILKVLKWLFIEQDITYWNYDGRTMLRQAIDKELIEKK